MISHNINVNIFFFQRYFVTQCAKGLPAVLLLQFRSADPSTGNNE